MAFISAPYLPVFDFKGDAARGQDGHDMPLASTAIIAPGKWVEIRANDEIEAMLAVQMVATHFAATRALVSQQDSNGNLAVKLLRTFAAQTEALQRYRGKGQQKLPSSTCTSTPAGRQSLAR